MKIKKSILKAVALAVAVTTITTACTDTLVSPDGEKKVTTKKADPCPGCGMG